MMKERKRKLLLIIFWMYELFAAWFFIWDYTESRQFVESRSLAQVKYEIFETNYVIQILIQITVFSLTLGFFLRSVFCTEKKRWRDGSYVY